MRKTYNKLFGALLGAFFATLAAVAPHGITSDEWWTVLAATAGAGAVTYAAPRNAD